MSNYDKKLFLDDVDAQGIKLFMLSHKVVEGEDGPELALTTENDPENMWNTRFTQEITENTNYDDLVGHAFMDTSILKVVVAPGDTIDTRTGIWIYINKRGAKAEYAKDSASVLVQYIGTFLDDKQFALTSGKTIQLVAGGADYGLMVGIKYLDLDGWKRLGCAGTCRRRQPGRPVLENGMGRQRTGMGDHPIAVG